MAAGSIILDLLMRTGSFETDTKKAQKRLRELKQEARDAGTAIGLGLAAAGGAVALLVKNAIDAADAAGKSAAAAGLAVESYTALAYAAELAGVEAGAFGTALNTLNKNIAENDKNFKALGISVQDAQGNLKATDDVLAELADRFAKMPDGPRKSQIAIDLLGRSGAQLIPLLNQGSKGLAEVRAEAERLGIVISADTAKAAEEFNDNMTRLTKTGQALGLALAKEILPTLNDFSSRVLKNAKDLGFFRGAFVALYETILGGTEPADVLERQSQKTAETIKGLRQEIATLTARGVGESFQGGVLGQLRAELALLEKEAKRSSQAITDALNEAAGRSRFGRGVGFSDPRLPAAKAPPAATKETKERTSEAERYLEALQKQLEETLELTSVEKALLDIQSGRISGLTPKLREQILAQAALNDANKQAIALRDAQVAGETTRAQAMNESLAAMEKGNKQLRDEIALIGLDQIGITSVERARISSARAIKEEERARREANGESETTLQVLDAEIAALREREELLGRKIERDIEERGRDQAKQAGDKASSALADSIEAGILDGFRRGQSLTDVFINELKAQFAKTILRPIIAPVAEAGNELIGQIIGGIAGALGGGSGYNPTGDTFSQTGDMIRGRRARGGEVHPGGDYLVGENGPERFRPSTSGMILPSSDDRGRRDRGVVIENHGAKIEQQTDPSGQIRLIINASVSEVDRRIGSRGSTGQALARAGLNLDRSIPRRG